MYRRQPDRHKRAEVGLTPPTDALAGCLLEGTQAHGPSLVSYGLDPGLPPSKVLPRSFDTSGHSGDVAETTTPLSSLKPDT